MRRVLGDGADDVFGDEGVGGAARGEAGGARLEEAGGEAVGRAVVVAEEL